MDPDISPEEKSLGPPGLVQTKGFRVSPGTPAPRVKIFSLYTYSFSRPSEKV